VVGAESPGAGLVGEGYRHLGDVKRRFAELVREAESDPCGFNGDMDRLTNGGVKEYSV